jgi:hypothetical protein
MTTCLRRQPEPTDQLVSRPRIHARCMCLAHRTTRLRFLDADCSQSSGTSCPSSRRVPAPAAKATPLDPGLHLWLCAHAPGKLPAVWTCWAPGVQPDMARHSSGCQWAAHAHPSWRRSWHQRRTKRAHMTRMVSKTPLHCLHAAPAHHETCAVQSSTAKELQTAHHMIHPGTRNNNNLQHVEENTPAQRQQTTPHHSPS